MKTLLTKIFTATASAAVAVAGLSGLAKFSQTVRADFYTPRLIVTGSEISKDRVNAGDEFDLTVHFINESEDTHLYNIKIAFTSEDNEMYPVSGTNVYYVDTVEDEEEFDVTVKMATRSDLAPKPYTLTVSYEFEDRDKMYFQDSSEIVIPIYQTPELSVSDLKLTKSDIEIGSKTSFSMKLNNTGKADIYNVAVSVAGDTINEVDTIVGNLEKGANSTIDLSLKGASAGSDDVKVKITYEDIDGKLYELTKTIKLTVSEPVPVELEAETAPSFNIVYVIAAVGAIVVIIVVVSIIRKVREKKYA